MGTQYKYTPEEIRINKALFMSEDGAQTATKQWIICNHNWFDGDEKQQAH